MIAPPVGRPSWPGRVAWFSPVPPSSSGIAAYTAELVPALRARGVHVDVFADGPASGDAARHVRDFVWLQRRAPYDLTVYHLGNARCHDFMWGYLFHYPGLVVLHDAQIHQARARQLLQRWVPRRDDYLAEFAASHPAAPADLARLFAAGLGGSLYGHWPHVALVLRSARLTAVHSVPLAARLADAHGVDVDAVPMGVPDPLQPAPLASAAAVRARHGVPDGAVVVGAFGGMTPEKRLPALLRATAGVVARDPRLHLLLVGAPAAHYDVAGEARALGLAAHVHVAGFVDDADIGAYLAAMDGCACLRWPTNGETSASWWRAMAAGRATIVTDLVHQGDVPVLDARNWRPLQSGAAAAVAAAVPILDEHAGLVAALTTFMESPSRRAALGTAARAFWQAGHTLDAMADAYVPLLARAAGRPAPRAVLPAHLAATGDGRLTALLAPFGVPVPVSVA